MLTTPLVTQQFYLTALFTYVSLIAVACLVMAFIVTRKKK